MSVFRLFLGICLLWSTQLLAQPKHSFKDFIELETGRSVYVEYTAPAKGMPTLIVLNGLTYSTKNNDRYVAHLIDKGVGILSYDPMGMGKTLLRYAPVTEYITLDNQVRDLALLLNKLKFNSKLNIAGLSYGGGLALAFAAVYPDHVQNIIAMAPFTQPLEAQDSLVQAQVDMSKWMWPFNQMTDEELYAYFFRQLAYASYPVTEPTVLENPYKLDAVTYMALGARRFKAADVAHKLPEGSLHLVVARQDQYIPIRTLNDFWGAVPVSKKASRIFLNGSEHKIIEFVPHYAAAWTYKILKGEEALFENNDFEGFPFLNSVYIGGGVYDPSVVF